MHHAAYAFTLRALLASGVAGKAILEIGSLDVNSTEQGMSLRDLCTDAERYLGIDEQIGLGVDVVASARDFDGAHAFDIAISTEALEHTLEPREILDCAHRALKAGGLLVLTAAGPGRPAHNCDGGPHTGVEHYANIEPNLLMAWLQAGGWADVRVEENTIARDVYATARRK
jgi:SAM-dependent methyltransferase